MRSHKHYWSDIVNPGIPRGGEEGQILIKNSEDTNDYVWADPPSGRNAIINSNFDVWQRTTSQTSTGYGSDDRWRNTHNGTTKIHSRQAFTVGQTDVPYNPKYFSRSAITSVAGVSNYAQKVQRIEDVSTFAGETATLSFYAKADASKSMAIEFIQVFGTGGSPSASVDSIASQKVSLTTVWQEYTITIAIPSISGKTLGTDENDSLQLSLWFDAGSDFNARTDGLGQQSGTFDISQVQLEAGTYATPFEKKTYGQELLDCQRYYQDTYVPAGTYFYNTAGSPRPSWLIGLPVQMREVAVASVKQTISYTNCTFLSFDVGESWVSIIVTVSSTGNYLVQNGVIALDAEL